jgi:hypothetical protein
MKIRTSLLSILLLWGFVSCTIQNGDLQTMIDSGNFTEDKSKINQILTVKKLFSAVIQSKIVRHTNIFRKSQNI